MPTINFILSKNLCFIIKLDLQKSAQKSYSFKQYKTGRRIKNLYQPLWYEINFFGLVRSIF